MIFDEKIRSIMENGSEEVPAGLWEAVESRIPAGSGKKRGAFIWLWSTGAALSAAAAVVLAVVFAGHGNKEGQIEILTSPSGILTDVPGDATSTESLSEQRDMPSGTRDFIPQAVTDGIQDKVEGKDFIEEAESPAPAEETASATDAAAAESTPAVEVSTPAAEVNTATAEVSTPAAEGNVSAAASGSIVESEEFDESGREIERKEMKKGAASFEAFGNALTNLSKPGIEAPAAHAPGRMLARKAPTSSSVEPTSDRKYGLPMSFGVGVKIPLAPKWSIGVGLDASLLTNSFAGNYTKVGEDMIIESYVFPNIRNTQVYLGLPVNVYFSIINNSFLDFYAYGGGSVEKCLLNKYNMFGDPEKLSFKDKTGGVQGSVGAGLGIEFIVAKRLGIFLDPSVRYYINGKNSPKSIRTAQPLMVGGELGLRVRL